MYKVGDILAGCKLLKECGAGSFGSVFLAENLTTHQKYALKILYKHGNHYERELAGLIAYQEKCAHANLMRIYHVDQNDECIFYTMDAADNLNSDGEYLPDTLANRLRKRRRLEASELRPMLDELLNGLEILHGMGLLHRDIKPDNILWVSGHAVLGDIGLVAQNIHATMAGTPGFISPEVWNGKRDFAQRDDLYALAMTLYCALSGCSPRDYPDLPFSLTLGGGRDLIRMYNAVLQSDSPIQTVADFRFALALKTGKTHWILSKEFLLYGFFSFLLLGGLIAWRISVERSFDRRQVEFEPKTILNVPTPEAQPSNTDDRDTISQPKTIVREYETPDFLLQNPKSPDKSKPQITYTDTTQEWRLRTSANEEDYPILAKRNALLKRFFADVMGTNPKLSEALQHQEKLFNKKFYQVQNTFYGENWLRIKLSDNPAKELNYGWLKQYEAQLSILSESEQRLIKRWAIYRGMDRYYLPYTMIAHPPEIADQELKQWEKNLSKLAVELK